jgi:glycosyltransferase involved in cell wall biosynthesis
MRILFVHQNFPGQFVHLANHYASDSNNKVVAITDKKNNNSETILTKRYSAPAHQYGQARGLSARFAEHVIRAKAVAEAAQELRNEGFHPDLILGHFGWGETIFLKDIWPQAKLIVYAEFFYGGEDSDTGFDPEFPSDSLPIRFGNRVRNASLLTALIAADQAIAPTHWQRNQFPIDLQHRINVVHDGIDTVRAVPNLKASVRLKREGIVLRTGDEIVTFVSRNLEPYRGYHIFIRALPRILAERPNARALIIGGDGVSYGPPAPDGRKWRDVFLNEVRDRLDLSRVHFVGHVPHSLFLRAMQASAAHVYFTYPFVLSWSMLEAMACGALIVGSDTAPVQEIIRHRSNGLLLDFFNADALAEQVIDALAAPDRYHAMRIAARRTVVDRYDLRRVCLPKQLDIIRRANRSEKF